MFLFHFQNVQQRSLSKQNSSYFVNQYISDPAITLKDIQASLEKGDTTFVNKIQTFCTEKARGTDAFSRGKNKELDAWIQHHLNEKHGVPTLFLTLSCAEYWWEDLSHLLKDRLTLSEDFELAQDLCSQNKEKQNSSTAIQLSFKNSSKSESRNGYRQLERTILGLLLHPV